MASFYRMQRNVLVPMRDGVALCADIWLPEGDGPFPVLLERTPYDKTSSLGSQSMAGPEYLPALDAGFAVVTQDTRGRWASQGEFTPFTAEAADGVETVRWLRAQPFCDGRVCTFGGSYVGATQMLLAARSAPGHVAMAPQMTTAEYFENWTYRSGALQLGFILLWIMEALGGPDLGHRKITAGKPAWRYLAGMLADPLAAMSRLPVLTDELAELAPYAADWLARPTRDGYWRAIAPGDRFADVSTAGLHIAGWNDIFLEGSLRNYAGLRSEPRSDLTRASQYLIIGPWSHGNLSEWQGDRWHGYAAAASVNFTAMHLEFFRAVLDGRPPELPRVHYFTSGTDRWQSADDWPVPVAKQSWFLGESDGERTLTMEPPGQAARSDSYVSDPLDPVPTVGGATFLPGVALGRNSGPKSQLEVERRRDVLVYTSAPLAADLEVTGEVLLKLWASSTAADCDWTARLADVDHIGASTGIVDGILRARYRHDDRPLPLQPGVPEQFTVRLGNTSHVFRAGRRVRIQIASSNFPRFDRNPQQMVEPATATSADFRSARQTVFRDAARPSRLELPVTR